MRREFQQRYTFEVKLEAVQRFERQEATLSELADEYGMSSSVLLKTWVRIHRREGEEGLRSKRKGRPPGAVGKQLTEVQKLEKENERLRAEVAYRKKVRALRAQGLQ
ncbi:transposase [Arthrobacter woluwensis]|uniref:transposase n=1 Tax=Arthrobacter woluwensis TaxID=156980 RepID=UPI00146FEB4D|nr:transposase [Arthrobacter woluwensis]